MTPIQALEKIRNIAEGNVTPVSLQREILAAVAQGLAAPQAPSPSPISSRVLARDLKPGDVVTGEGENPVSILDVKPRLNEPKYVDVMLADHGRYGEDDVTECVVWVADVPVVVERPALTLAQQHADDLYEYAKHLLADVQGNGAERGRFYETNLRELLAKIDPPQPPPTLEEALDVLRQWTKYVKGATISMGSPPDQANKLLDRVPK